MTDEEVTNRLVKVLKRGNPRKYTAQIRATIKPATWPMFRTGNLHVPMTGTSVVHAGEQIVSVTTYNQKPPFNPCG